MIFSSISFTLIVSSTDWFIIVLFGGVIKFELLTFFISGGVSTSSILILLELLLNPKFIAIPFSSGGGVW